MSHTAQSSLALSLTAQRTLAWGSAMLFTGCVTDPSCQDLANCQISDREMDGSAYSGDGSTSTTPDGGEAPAPGQTVNVSEPQGSDLSVLDSGSRQAAGGEVNGSDAASEQPDRQSEFLEAEAGAAADKELVGGESDAGCVGECQSCGPGLIDCGGDCVDPGVDIHFCGATADCLGEGAGQVCQVGQVCKLGQCLNECSANEVRCDQLCVDPLVDTQFCGAGGDCSGVNAGAVCGSDQSCELGRCRIPCAAGWVRCGNTCVDPMTDDAFCGAANLCESTDSGKVCSDQQACVAGACREWRTAERLEGVAPLPDLGEGAQVRLAGNGNAYVLWQRSGILFAIRYRSESGTWSPPTQLAAGSALAFSSAIGPASAGEDGSLYVAWTVGGELWFNWADPQGVWQGEERLNADDPDVLLPSALREVEVAFVPGQTGAVLTWIEEGVLGSRWRSSPLSSWGGRSVLDAHEPTALQTGLRGDSTGAAVFNTADGLAVSRLQDRTWSTPISVPGSDGTAASARVTLGAEPNSPIVVAWAQTQSLGEVREILSTRLDPATSSWTPVNSLSGVYLPGSLPHGFSLRATGGHRALLLWGMQDSASGRPIIPVYELSDTGLLGVWSTDNLVGGAGLNGDPQLEVDASGNAFAVCAHHLGDSTNPHNQIIVERYDSNKAAWSSPRELDVGSGAVTAPTLGVATDGSALVVWGQDDPTSGEQAVWYAWYQ